MDDQDMRAWDATTTAARIAAGQVSAREVVAAAIGRAEAAEATIHALVVRTPERAVANARRIDDRRAAGEQLPALAGVPTAAKDLSDVAGVPTRHGSRAIIDHVPTRDSEEVTELLSSGLVSIGKSATPEFGFVATTEPLFGEPTRNPWRPSHSAGGSSGGAGALVAAGVVPIAHATDGGGSIRIPAAVNGLVGLKPTVDRHVRMAKMAHLPIRISVSNVLTRTVADTAAHMAALERHHRNTSLPPIGHVTGPANRRLRIGVIIDGPNATTAAPIAAAVRATADHLAGLGHAVTEVVSPFGRQFSDDFVLYWASLAMLNTPMLKRSMGDRFDPELLDPFTVGLTDHARANLARIPLAVRRLRRSVDTYAAMFRDVDLVLTPTLAQLTPPIGATSPDRSAEELLPWLADFAQFTPLGNATGAPGISVPAGMHDGLPIGAHLMALPGDDRALLEVAWQLEQATGPWPMATLPG